MEYDLNEILKHTDEIKKAKKEFKHKHQLARETYNAIVKFEIKDNMSYLKRELLDAINRAEKTKRDVIKELDKLYPDTNTVKMFTDMSNNLQNMNDMKMSTFELWCDIIGIEFYF